MIQRIQSLYLLIAALLLVSMFFIPLAGLKDVTNQMLILDLTGVKSVEQGSIVFPSFHLALIIGVSALFLLSTIFLFRKRILQIRLCIFNILLLLGFYAMFFFLAGRVKAQLSSALYYQLPVMFPVVSVILLFLAIRSIRKDIMLIRSYDRIR